jgi:hypothetical protein
MIDDRILAELLNIQSQIDDLAFDIHDLKTGLGVLEIQFGSLVHRGDRLGYQFERIQTKLEFIVRH